MKLSALFSILLISACCSGLAAAADIGVVAILSGKAILVIDGAAPKTYEVGAMLNSETRLLAVDGDNATISTNGKRQVLRLGQTDFKTGGGKSNQVVLKAGDHGHFMAPASINGVALSMMVDTGASLIALPASEARRIGINYKAGRPGRANTAGGVVNTYLIKLDSIKIGDIELFQVDASVIEAGLSMPLLGMSFLNRMEMRREGEQMTLTKRF
ncbi:MAG: retropepsin-like aspartic protease family protein [Undibacterium curvum]|jgi:aspartyl protease family protein|uniref:Retroviral-like aspartic protease family protein n=1 Tax=Undibacterium curvum TaxID=2762294 RepID=A0ABR7A4F6_9BURK|nr:retropepsin-like aspartic protease [Undibacterium curvum]MBC3931796.1 retroviral-like aspartic protease family protein [Undibacterium curvum]